MALSCGNVSFNVKFIPNICFKCFSFHILLSLFLITIANKSPAHVTVATIQSLNHPENEDRLHTLGREHAVKFINEIFAPNPVKDRQIWPAVFTENCMHVNIKDSASFNKVHAPGFQRGLILAHRQIWEEFLRTNGEVGVTTGTGFNSPKLVVFENDAMEIDPSVGNVAYQSVMNMTSDLHVLGHCYDRNPGEVIPECNHAYALTVNGCRILMKHIDHCARNGPLDHQFKALGINKLLNWTAVPARRPYGISDDYIRNNAKDVGYTVEYGNQIGGLFYQVRFDDILVVEEGKLYRSEWPFNKWVFLCKNGSLHLIPDHRTFMSLGFDYDINPVVTLPHFEVDRLMKEPIPVAG